MNELDVLRDVVRRLEEAGLAYMLTGSMALNLYAHPRLTRDIDVVLALVLKDVPRLAGVFGPDYYFSPESAEEAVREQRSFNMISQAAMVKVDFMIRRREEYRLEEFARRRRVAVGDFELWAVSKEDLIISKLDWARESLSERQLADVENLLATGCDMEYVKSCAARLSLTAMLTRVSP